MRQSLLVAAVSVLSLGCVGLLASSALADATAPTTQPLLTRWVPFGEPMKLADADNIDAGKVLADVPAYTNKPVRVVGTVKKVCAKKGCWLQMSSEGTSLNIFVKFTCPIDGRLIPIEAIGRAVKVEGVLTVTEVSEKEAKEELEEAGASKEEIDAVKGPQKQISIEGPSALVEMPVV